MRRAPWPAAWPCTSFAGRRRGRGGGGPGCRPGGPAYRWWKGRRCSFVDVFRVLQRGVDGDPRRAAGRTFEAPEEAAGAAGVAGAAAFLVHLEQHDVAVAVQAQVVHGLRVSGFFALAPQALRSEERRVGKGWGGARWAHVESD